MMAMKLKKAHDYFLFNIQCIDDINIITYKSTILLLRYYNSVRVYDVNIKY